MSLSTVTTYRKCETCGGPQPVGIEHTERQCINHLLAEVERLRVCETILDEQAKSERFRAVIPK